MLLLTGLLDLLLLWMVDLGILLVVGVLARDGLREVGRGVHARQELKEKTRMATEGGSEGLKNGTEDEEKEVNGVRRGSETA